MLWIITGIITSYILGSIPTAYIFGRLLKGIDIRKAGSGNVGATNAMRVLGKGPGITVLLLDIFKGIVPVIFLGNFLLSKRIPISEETLRIILGLACISGHNWTIFLQFKGGKGVATTLGVLIGLAFKINGLNLVLGLVLVSWIVVFFVSRIVSIASCFSALALPFLSIIFNLPKLLILTSVILSASVILRHKSNLKRFFQGKEKRLF
ncbi:MAG: glycerol-3-phosphate 1-O-acyltransferase PlsY [Candidatus Omnitrophica bacterium]|nr:glycerol-3-phosphate 1-O-acyltransferase PlsY [Candidatus Omnitrophota bacterium]